MAALLSAIINTNCTKERETLYNQINALEEIGDDITHKVYLGLDKVFFTPLNRNDIHILASAIDDVADNIHEAAGRMHIYNVNAFSPAIGHIADYIQRSCTEIQRLIGALSKPIHSQDLQSSCQLIKDFEHQADQIYYSSLADLFNNEKNPITLIKHRDILSSLEASANKCKHVTDTIEIIILNSL